ncbi:hypothetical protein ACFRR6_01490 [Streptomyces sp. NPDC056891]
MIDAWSTVSSTVQYRGVCVLVRRYSVQRTDESVGTLTDSRSTKD